MKLGGVNVLLRCDYDLKIMLSYQCFINRFYLTEIMLVNHFPVLTTLLCGTRYVVLRNKSLFYKY